MFNYMPQVEQDVIIERLTNLIRENFEAHKQIKDDQAKILIQTTLTNGTVSKLKEWKATATGGFIVVNLLVVPVVLWLFFERLKLGS